MERASTLFDGAEGRQGGAAPGLGEGARIIFDPIAGPLVEKLAAAAADGIICSRRPFLLRLPCPKA
jgi:hypothetical protein